MSSTIFDKIVSGEIKAWTIWEDDNYMAFLTPFPNTPGFTVVIPKNNPGDYVFELDDKTYQELMNATKRVAKLLQKALNVKRVAMVFEGTGVAHVHAKLVPLHGGLAGETGVFSKETEFHPEYIGYITTAEGPKMDDAELDKIQAQIKAAA